MSYRLIDATKASIEISFGKSVFTVKKSLEFELRCTNNPTNPWFNQPAGEALDNFMLDIVNKLEPRVDRGESNIMRRPTRMLNQGFILVVELTPMEFIKSLKDVEVAFKKVKEAAIAVVKTTHNLSYQVRLECPLFNVGYLISPDKTLYGIAAGHAESLDPLVHFEAQDLIDLGRLLYDKS